MIEYAVVQTGGKQYRVRAGDTIDVEKLDAEVGDIVELPEVLLVSHDGGVTLGQPTVEGSHVVAEVENHAKDKKVVIFKYHSKTRYRLKKGHRQPFTRLRVKDVVVPEALTR